MGLPRQRALIAPARAALPTRLLVLASASLASALATGCDLIGGTGETATTATASAPPAPTASAAPPAPVKPSMEVVGEGVQAPVSVDKVEGCQTHTSDLATYLQRGELTLAGRGEEIAAAWLVQLTGRAQIGFAGFNLEAEKIARDRGIGNAREHPPRLFATPAGWTVAWFDPEGLAYAHPTWESNPGPEIQHLAAVKGVAPEAVALASAPNGSLIAASPFGAEGQLSIFEFAPVAEGGEPVKAVGVTKTARDPQNPAVLGDEQGYTLAWHEGDDRIVASRFTAAGKETTDQSFVIVEGGDKKRQAVALAKLGAGAIALWSEGDALHARALDARGAASSPIWKVGEGTWASIIATEQGALAVWVSGASGDESELRAVRIGAEGPSKKGVVVSRGKPVKDAPAVATAGSKIAFAWTEPMSISISSKRAVLRIVDAGCL